MICYLEFLAKLFKTKLNLNVTPLRSSHKEKANINEIIQVLRELGVANGDSIMVHSSLSHINSTAEVVIKAFQDLVGNEGNLLMPTHPDLVQSESGYLSYDKEISKSRVGYLTEYFRHLNGVDRDCHPFSSVASWGQDRDWFLNGTREELLPLPHGNNSPYDRLAQIGGKVICIGVTAKNRATIKHTAEEKLDEQFPLDMFETVDIQIKEGATIYVRKFRRTKLKFSEIFMCKSKIEREWLKWGILKKQKIGRVPIEVLDAKCAVNFMRESILCGSTSYPLAPSKYRKPNAA